MKGHGFAVGCVKGLCKKVMGMGKDSKGSKGSEGRVDGALGPEGCGRLSAAGCGKGLRKRVLKMDRPNGRRVLKFDGLSGRGLWWRLAPRVV